MFEWIAKKVLIGKLNDLLKSHQQGIDKLRAILKIWTSRLSKVLACFESILEKLDDNDLTAEELKQTTEEISTLVKEW